MCFIRNNSKWNFHELTLKVESARPHRLSSRLWSGRKVWWSGATHAQPSAGMLEPASILQINRHTRSAPGVTPNRRQKPRVPRSFANGCPGIVPVQRAPANRGARLVDALKQRLFVVDTNFEEESCRKGG